MSLAGAMNSAISGLYAQTSALATVSNNLANSSTTAFKTSTTSFASLVAGSGSTKSGGVSASTVSNVTSQGLLVDSTISTNLAIEGDGYFIVSAEGDDSSRYYTRNGEFSINDEGYLTNGDYYLLGWETDEDGNVSGGASSVNLTTIDLTSVQSSAEATTEVGISAQLPSDAETDSSFQQSFEVYDSLGTASTITATYTKTGENTWTVSYSDPVSADGDTSTGTITANTDTDSDGTDDIYQVEITFNEDGTFASSTPSNIELEVDWSTGAATSTIDIDLGSADGSDGLTQYSSNEGEDADIVAGTIDSDGRAYGTLTGVEIDTDGTVIASFSNGETSAIYKIPLATFTNADGLTEGNDGIYSISYQSGNATILVAGTGGAGSISASQLEASNVDTSTEFSNMLAAQQAYSSASQIISASNEMFDSLMGAVR